MAQEMETIAAGRVVGGTGAFTGQGAVVARTGAGVYTITLDQAAHLCVKLVTLEASGTFGVADTSDTVKTVSTFAVDGTTATDKSFSFLIMQVAGL